jgi:phage portal protein BeeE
MANPLAVAARSLVRSAAVTQKDLQIFYDRATIPQTIGRSSTSGLSSNVLMSPVMWVMRAFTEALLIVQRREVDAGGGLLWKRSLDHDVELLVRRPNPYYTADALWKATALSYVIDGNAYWQKIRNPLGEVIRLWYIPHWMIRPVRPFDGRTYLSHYELSMGSNGPHELAPRDVVHFRFGLDPVDTLLGYSPLKAILSEVLTDDEAAKFSQHILNNMGVPGLIVAPSKEAQSKPTTEDV